MKFEEYRISKALKKGIALAGFRRPTDIQFKAIPSILKGEDVLAIAQTGTGKTGAFAIPIIHVIHEAKQSVKRKDGVQCLVLVPTHELAIQIADVFNVLEKFCQVSTMAIHGGVEQAPQIEKLDQGVDIVVATPGRMFDLISQGHLRTHRVTTLILDEADHMLDLGFKKDIDDLKEKLPRKRQTLFFSATINKTIKKLAYSLVKDAIRIQIAPKDPVSKNIEHFLVHIEMDHKRFFLEKLIKDNIEDKYLVFVRTKVRAARVEKAMAKIGLKTMCIHGDKDQEERDAVMDAFKNSEIKILIATDVSARGIDIKDVDTVINYDIPDIAQNYVHRIGRTGRGKRKGKAISFSAPKEADLLKEVEAYLGKEIPIIQITKNTYNQVLEIQYDQDNNIDALMKEIEMIEDKKRKKSRKKKSK